MYDKELVLDILSGIYKAARTILKRFEPVKSASDFTDSEAGMEKLDSICMLLVAIGESVKKIDKITNKTLLARYPQIEWKKIMGLRDIISHHYFDLNAEAIFNICKNHVNELAETIKTMIHEIK